MPLLSGKSARSKQGFSENVKREMKNHPQKQAVAIAYSEARHHSGKKMSSQKGHRGHKSHGGRG